MQKENCLNIKTETLFFLRERMENMKINYGEKSRESMKDDDFGQKGVPVHSQVRRIKQESENILDWWPVQPEIRPVLREITRQISRSPLGISC